MKHFKHLWMLLAAMLLSINVWGETATLSISSGFTSNGSRNDDKSNSWAIASDGSYTSSTSYIQVGTNKAEVTYLKLSTSAYSTKSISKIQVWGTSKANTNVTAKVSIGGNSLGESTSAYATQNASSGGTEFFVENPNGYKGDILIEISRPSKATGAIYFNKLIVTYSEGGSTETAVSSVALNKTTLTLEEGATETLTATIAPDNATNKNVTWESDNTDVATVVDGKVTAKAAGEAVITVKSAADATKTASCTVTVNAPAPFEGTVIAWVAADQGYTNGEQYTSATADANISFAFGDGGNDGKYYDTGKGIRIYSNGKVTVTAGNEAVIKKIVITYDAGNAGTFSANAGDYSLSEATGTWTGSASSVVLTNTATSGHARIQTITVSYTGGATAPTLESISIKTAPTKVEYVAGQKFNPAGLVITKTMSDATTADVEYAGNESDFTFAPALTAALATTDTKVTITYGGKSVDQAITVTPWVQTYANTYTSAAGLLTTTDGTSASVAKVKIDGTEYNAIKAGTGKVAGVVKVTVPANTKTLHFHLAGWKEEGKKVKVSGLSADEEITIIPDASIQGTETTFELQNDPEEKDYFFINTDNTEALTLTFTATEGKRFVIFGVNAEAGEAPVLQSVVVSGAPTKKEYIAGENFAPAGLVVTAKYDKGADKIITEGITWSTPDALIAGQASVSITATVAGITSAAYEVTGLTVSAPKNLDHITLNTESVKKEFWKGETFNYTGLVVTAHYDDETSKVVDPLSVSTPDMTLFGEAQTITVAYKEADVTKEATYEITVKTIANTQENAYTTTEAIALIDAGKDLSTEVYVKGKVSDVEKFNESYNSITYWLDGKSFEVYSGKGINGADFASIDDIAVNADVIIKGIIKKFNSTTYEFDKNNVLVYYKAPVKTNPDLNITGYLQNMSADDDADEVNYTKKGDGAVSATSSNETVATVEVGDGIITVTPVAAGTTTITVSVAETETYNAGSKTYTLTVKAGLTAAALPFTFDGGASDINVANGIKAEGLGSNYSSSPKLRFDGAGDNVVIRVAEAIKKVEYKIKGNGYTAGQFDILQSADGKTYTALKSYTSDMPSDATVETTAKPAADTRYIKFVYTTKNAGNVALGAINITAASVVDPAELEFAKASYRFVTTDEMVVVAVSKAGSTGAITYSCEDANLTIDAETGVITCTTAGTYTINAAIAATGDYMAGNASCTVKIVEPAVANSIIVAEADGKVFAMTNTAVDASNDYIESVEIKKVGDVYIVSDETYDAILYQTATGAEGKTSIVSMSNMYLQATAAKNVSYTETEYLWTLEEGKLTAADADHGTLQYNTSNPRFTTYGNKVGQYATIVSLDKVAKGEGVALVGNTLYASLAEAVAAAPADGTETTITMLADVELTAAQAIALGQNIVLDLNGKNITSTKTILSNKGKLVVTGTGNITVSGTSKTAYGISNSGGAALANRAYLTVGENVTITAPCTAVYTSYAYTTVNGTLANTQAETSSNLYSTLRQSNGSEVIVAATASVTGQVNAVYGNYGTIEVNSTNVGKIYADGSATQGLKIKKTTAIESLDVVGHAEFSDVEDYYVAAKAFSGCTGTVKLLSDINGALALSTGKTVTLDLNGHKVVAENYPIKVEGTLTITGEGTVQSTGMGSSTAVQAAAYVLNNGKLTIESGNFVAGYEGAEGNPAVYVRDNAVVEIKGGDFVGGSKYLLNKLDAARETSTIEVTGGTFYGFNPADNIAEGEHTNFCAAGYVAHETSTGIFEVVEASTDATLSDLTVAGETIEGFDAAVLTYTYTVAYDATVVPVVTATANSTYATAVVTPAANLDEATTILVTAESGATQTYTVNFEKEAAPEFEWIRTTTVGKLVTMCQAKAITALQGAIAYEVEKKNGSGIGLVEAEFPLIAGKPYILQATATEIKAIRVGVEAIEAVAANAANGLVGNLSTAGTDMMLPNSASETGYYIFLNNHICAASGEKGNFVAPDRAYLNMNAVGTINAAPGRRRITMTTDATTGMMNILDNDNVNKMLINGQLYIIRGGKAFNAAGQLVK